MGTRRSGVAAMGLTVIMAIAVATPVITGIVAVPASAAQLSLQQWANRYGAKYVQLVNDSTAAIVTQNKSTCNKILNDYKRIGPPPPVATTGWKNSTNDFYKMGKECLAVAGHKGSFSKMSQYGLAGATATIGLTNALNASGIVVKGLSNGLGTSATTTTHPSPTPTTAAGPKTKFGDGTWAVNQQIAPGTYDTSGGSNCYWERDSDLTGNTSSILANDNASGPVVVTILPNDVGFKTQGCGTWNPQPSSGPQATTFGPGTYAVGIGIAPGTYSAPGGGNCYWETESDLTGDTSAIISNDNPSGPVTVTIDPSDKGFKSSGCGTWTTAS